MKKNALQINYWVLGGFEGKTPVAKAIDETAKMGLDGIELVFGAGEFAPGISAEKCAAIRAHAKRRNIKIETLASGFFWDCPLSSEAPAVRRKAIKFLKEYLRVAAIVGAKSVLVLPGAVAVPWDPSKPVVPYAAAWKNAAASIRACLRDAEKLKVTIALENVWGWFLTDPMAMKLFVDQFKSKRVGVYFDLANCLINGYPEHWIEILGKRIAAIHLKNFSRKDCGGGIYGFGDDIRKGDLDFDAVFKALRRIEYSGPITAEMIPFCRLPNLVLPDLPLARETGARLKQLAKRM